MKTEFKDFPKQEAPRPKAIKQLVDAFCNTYQTVATEDAAEEVFTIRRLREFFQAWPMPKMPDPIPPYIDELEIREYVMKTGYDGSPAIFCVRKGSRGQICVAEEIFENNMLASEEYLDQLIADRMSRRSDQESDSQPEEDNGQLDDNGEEDD